MKEGVVVYLVEEDNEGRAERVCLGMKKIRYAKGKWNGFGGKVEEEESVEQAAVRELQEESGVKIKQKDLIRMAEITYKEPAGDWIVYAFICNKWRKSPQETEEMRPKWFAVNEIPYENMWENDELWLPRVLKGERLTAKVVHDENDKVVSHELIQIENFS